MDMGNATGAFCVGDGMVMQSGFQVAWGPGQMCTLFLFPSWVVDTAGKYVGAVIAAFVLGSLLEGLSFCRRLYALKFLSPASRTHPLGDPRIDSDRNASVRRSEGVTVADVQTPEEAAPARGLSWKHFVPSLLYAAQMVLAYWAMLLAMLYESVIFAALVVGLGTGHAVFSVYLPGKLGGSHRGKEPGSRAERFPLLSPVAPNTPCCGGARDH